MTFLYDFSTTGAISFSEIVNDPSGSFTRRISEATQIRSKLRGTLKESKRNDGEKDYLTVIKIIDEYLPQLQSIMNCVAHGDLQLKSAPVFSWRTTLSANLFHSSPRVSLSSFHAEHACCLLTYAFAFSNLARTIVTSLGAYEHDRAISQSEREAKEGQLKHATGYLGRASGIFTFLSETVLPELERSKSSSQLPVDLFPEVCTSLAKMSLADAQTLAIRKLLSKSFYDSNVAPGPPLPKSHPAPGLIAKLHLECASLYSSARTLAKTQSSSSKSSEDVSTDLRHYMSGENALHSALAKKWLGIDAGERGGEKKAGDAIGFLLWAKKELQDLKDGGKGVGLAKSDKEKRDRSSRKEKVANELEIIDVWLKHYKKVNDTVHFQPIPSQADLQSRMPTGATAVYPTAYVPSKLTFGPGSEAQTQSNDNETASDTAYAGAGEYY
ncbi:BRO1 domain-containing protein [Rhodocollybia butyracea]|uniref:pH-response regulator protein palC n=1 Tax=Rhodocollybia butyracea TaxID=206335 RepID=A0A9P5U6F5_9AGAR|nr:BRO1 domain-containing protein [Rhodocollybia butyracea]